MPTQSPLQSLAVSTTGFVFDPRTGATFSVNPTGLAVLLALRDGASIDDATAAVERAFDGAPAGTREDVLDFVQSLRGHGLLGGDSIRPTEVGS